MSQDGTEIIGESEGSSHNPTIEAENRARELNWKPKEEWKGAPEDWVDAREYLVREPLLKEVRELKKHIKTQREQTDRDMQIITAQFSQMSELAYKKAVSELETQRDLAIQDQDIKAVKELDKRISEADAEHLKTVAQTRPQQRVQDIQNEELDNWRKENTWFDKDQELQDEAVVIGVGYMQKNPKKTQAQMLQYVEDRVKKIYPDKFKPTQQKATMDEENNRVESRSTTPVLGKGKGKLSWGDLDDDERQIGRTLIKRGVLKEVATKNKRSEQDEYLAQLAERKAK